MADSGRTWAARKSRRYLYRLGPFGPPNIKHLSRTPTTQLSLVVPLPSPHKNSPRARPPAIPAHPSSLALSTASQPAHRSPSQRLSGLLPLTRFAVSTRAGSPSSRASPDALVELKSIWTLFTSREQNSLARGGTLEFTNREVQHVALCRFAGPGSKVKCRTSGDETEGDMTRADLIRILMNTELEE